MSESKDKKTDNFDLRAALTTQTQEREQQQQSHEQYSKVQEKEFSRLAAEAYNLISQRLEGIKGISVTTSREHSLPYDSLQIIAGKTIKFTPVDYRQYVTFGFRGKIEIKDGHQDTKFSIVMAGDQEGNWELGIAESRPQQRPLVQKLTVQTLDLLLGTLLGVKG